jgi:hypothetical protein
LVFFCFHIDIPLFLKPHDKIAVDADYGRSDNNDKKRWKNEQNQRKYQFHRHFGRHLFGSLKSFGSKGIRIHPQGIGDIRAEFVGLNQQGDKILDFLEIGALCQVFQGILPLFTGSELEA